MGQRRPPAPRCAPHPPCANPHSTWRCPCPPSSTSWQRQALLAMMARRPVPVPRRRRHRKLWSRSAPQRTAWSRRSARPASRAPRGGLRLLFQQPHPRHAERATAFLGKPRRTGPTGRGRRRALVQHPRSRLRRRVATRARRRHRTRTAQHRRGCRRGPLPNISPCRRLRAVVQGSPRPEIAIAAVYRTKASLCWRSRQPEQDDTPAPTLGFCSWRHQQEPSSQRMARRSSPPSAHALHCCRHTRPLQAQRRRPFLSVSQSSWGCSVPRRGCGRKTPTYPGTPGSSCCSRCPSRSQTAGSPR
mmetsp:Transcript_132951/g.384384  ORF Transcript_132951/g.384384 Transcript_132951/m.384384 type:complete len:302 (-) Transcript_132951:1460-2365(-)